MSRIETINRQDCSLNNTNSCYCSLTVGSSGTGGGVGPLGGGCWFNLSLWKKKKKTCSEGDWHSVTQMALAKSRARIKICNWEFVYEQFCLKYFIYLFGSKSSSHDLYKKLVALALFLTYYFVIAEMVQIHYCSCMVVLSFFS